MHTGERGLALMSCISVVVVVVLCFFFNDTATTEIYTLSLHDALPICQSKRITGHYVFLGIHGKKYIVVKL